MKTYFFKTNDRIADLDINEILDCEIKATSKKKAILQFKILCERNDIIIYDDEFTAKEIRTSNIGSLSFRFKM